MTVADARAVAIAMINARGYLVVCTTEPLRLGAIVNDPWTVDLGQPFFVVAETTEDDWDAQFPIARACVPPERWTLVPRLADPLWFYRVTTD